MKYVHESCLIKWLTHKNTQRCELCLQQYNITYEFGSLREILFKAIEYALRDKKRLLSGMLYALYLWIFFKRLFHMILGILKFVKNCAIEIFDKIPTIRRRYHGMNQILPNPIRNMLVLIDFVSPEHQSIA